MAVTIIISTHGWTYQDPQNADDDEIIFPFDGFVYTEEAVAGFVPYPNPRYAMSGGHQIMGGGVG